MDDAVLVRGLEGLGKLPADADALADRESGVTARAAFHLCVNQARERVALYQLHHEPAHTVALLEAVDLRDVGMIQRREGLGLALESRQALGVGGEGRRKDLDRDVAVEPPVVRAVDFSHAASTQWRDDFVRTQATARRQRHGFGSALVSADSLVLTQTATQRCGR